MRKVGRENDDNEKEDASADLTRRLARYRSRLEAEGRKRSLEVVDRAIRDAHGKKSTDR